MKMKDLIVRLRIQEQHNNTRIWILKVQKANKAHLTESKEDYKNSHPGGTQNKKKFNQKRNHDQTLKPHKDLKKKRDVNYFVSAKRVTLPRSVVKGKLANLRAKQMLFKMARKIS